MDRLDWGSLLNTLLGAIVMGVGLGVGIVIVAAPLALAYVAGGGR